MRNSVLKGSRLKILDVKNGEPIALTGVSAAPDGKLLRSRRLAFVPPWTRRRVENVVKVRIGIIIVNIFNRRLSRKNVRSSAEVARMPRPYVRAKILIIVENCWQLLVVVMTLNIALKMSAQNG